MVRIRGELARLSQGVNGDDFPALIEDADQSGLPSRPDLPPHILWRHGIIRALQLDVAVASHRAWRFLKHGKQTRRQRLKLHLPHSPQRTPCFPQSGWFSFDPYWLVLTVR